MRRFIFGLTILLFLSPMLWGMPPHPAHLDKIQTGELKAPRHDLIVTDEELLKAGFNPAQLKAMAPARPKAAGPYNMLVVLIDFSDKNSQVAPVFFDSLVFAQTQNSVWRYYDENSYGNFDLVTVNFPTSTGWQRAPQPSTYYANGQYGFGAYPQNAQKLVEEAVDLINPLVNFADYDNDNNGYVDGITFVHSGPGAEVSGSPNDIWSHKWGIVPRLRDGVYIFNYSMEPEYYNNPGDMTIGVYCHEFGHAIGGLPDLYDLDGAGGSSQGIGRWSVMAGGSWNGNPVGSSPAHFDAWCKIQLGFAVAGVITSNQTGVSIPNAEQSNAGIFRLWTNGTLGPEYFLVENRQRIGYDAALPANSSGLLIWHIDDTVSTGNNRPWYPPNSPSTGHYKVALVQADNLFQLEKNQNGGNSGDPYPGSTVNRNFDASTAPNSNGYAGAGSLVQVTNISNSGGTMTADFTVQVPTDVEDELFNRPKNFQLAQNYPNPFNPATVIAYTLEKSGPVELEIFNLLGEKIKTLASGRQGAGLHQKAWDGTDEGGRAVSSGLYLYRLRLEKLAETKKMMLVR
ncbi:MAG: M6 family metalloprotease domain-containing protein [candidate division Zixibacteria bacterium]|nr:M6 family metalloprotease domain-containing protein [candidate division Zixibacteria bacterium]